jgi:hypothetical protein
LNITINQSITAQDALNNINDRTHHAVALFDLLSTPLPTPSSTPNTEHSSINATQLFLSLSSALLSDMKIK